MVLIIILIDHKFIAIPINFITDVDENKLAKQDESDHVSETTDENTTTTKIAIEEKSAKKDFDPNNFMDEERRKLLIVSIFLIKCKNRNLKIAATIK